MFINCELILITFYMWQAVVLIAYDISQIFQMEIFFYFFWKFVTLLILYMTLPHCYRAQIRIM